MLDIEYKGGNAVIISTKKETLAVDPKTSLIGLKDVVVKGAIEVVTEPRFVVNGDTRLVIDGPGEYEVGDFSIRGMSAMRHIDADGQKRTTIYQMVAGDIRIALLGNITPKLSDVELEFLGVVDVLITPVGGGGYTLDATDAATIVRQIDPKVVIPTHFADDALKYEVPQDELATFVKELGAPVEKATKLKLKSSAVLPVSLTVFELSRS